MYSILGLAHKTLFIKLPEELLLYIIAFNEASAVKIIQQQYRNMLKNKIKIFTRIIRAGRPVVGIRRICDVFYNKKLVPQKELVKTFSRCDCCEKHKINRPNVLTNWVETEFHNTQHGLWISNDCNCSCRHYSRVLCREINWSGQIE